MQKPGEPLGSRRMSLPSVQTLDNIAGFAQSDVNYDYSTMADTLN
jgi:hypothetical protein